VRGSPASAVVADQAGNVELEAHNWPSWSRGAWPWRADGRTADASAFGGF